MHKTCTKCGEVKPLESFPAQKRNRDGRDSRCKVCAAANTRAWYANNREKALARSLEWEQRNAERRRAYLQKWFDENQEHRATWRKANADKLRASFKQWAAGNPGRVAAKKAKRRAALLQRTPPWVNHEDFIAIYAMRDEMTRATGVPHHVDHIIPLQGEKVSGLHVPWNLQVIPAAVNQSKKNKFLA